jgi:ferritin-like metal-binding protein YciE
MKKGNTQSNMGNRTGVMVNPNMAFELMTGVKQGSPEAELDTTGSQEIRAEAIQSAQPIGSVPPAKDPDKQVFIDKLGARLAFERSGARLYQMLMQKRSATTENHKPTLSDLEHIYQEELEHFQMLHKCMVQLGGDPTAITPAANIEGVISSGVFQIAADPRTTMFQCLDAALAAELVDNDCWTVLSQLASDNGLPEMAELFEEALEEEQEHLENVRSWIQEGLKAKAA